MLQILACLSLAVMAASALLWASGAMDGSLKRGFGGGLL